MVPTWLHNLLLRGRQKDWHEDTERISHQTSRASVYQLSLKQKEAKMKYYVLKGREVVGEAVLMGDEYYVHMYDSYLTHRWSVKKVPNKYKLEAKK